MAFDFSKGTATEKPKVLENKGFLQKAGEFLAPTATGLITGEKDLNLKTGLGAALEVGSFLIPSGAILKGLGLAGKVGSIGARGASVLGKVAESPGATKAILGGVKSATGAAERLATKEAGNIVEKGIALGSRLGGQAKRAGAIGGVSGTMFGAGRALGEEGSTFRDVAGQAAISGVTGALGGAVLAPAVSLASMGAKNLTKFTRDGLKSQIGNLVPRGREQALENLTEAYRNSFLEGSSAVIKKLEKEVVKARRFGGPTDEVGLIRELAEEGYVPKIEGEFARMRPVIDDLSDKIGKGMDEISNILEPIKTTTPVSVIKKRVQDVIKNDIGTDINKSLRESENLFKAIKKKYGSKLTPKQINEIRIEMNKSTRAFNKEIFAQDTKNALGSVTREVLDEVVPGQTVRRMNAEIAKLGRMRTVADVFNNRKIAVEFWGEAIGRFLGTLGGAGLGISVAGPGGLVIAGVLANIGSRAVASAIRRFRFNPSIVKTITDSLVKDTKLLDKILADATQVDRALIERAVGRASDATTRLSTRIKK